MLRGYLILFPCISLNGYCKYGSLLCSQTVMYYCGNIASLFFAKFNLYILQDIQYINMDLHLNLLRKCENPKLWAVNRLFKTNVYLYIFLFFYCKCHKHVIYVQYLTDLIGAIDNSSFMSLFEFTSTFWLLNFYLLPIEQTIGVSFPSCMIIEMETTNNKLNNLYVQERFYVKYIVLHDKSLRQQPICNVIPAIIFNLPKCYIRR